MSHQLTFADSEFSTKRRQTRAYLRHILSVLPEWPSNRVDELLPWNVVLTNK